MRRLNLRGLCLYLLQPRPLAGDLCLVLELFLRMEMLVRLHLAGQPHQLLLCKLQRQVLSQPVRKDQPRPLQ